jgi:hypothetical protein
LRTVATKGDVLLEINDKTEAVNLMWSGRETVAHAIEAVQRQASVEIALPASFHHALFSRLYPDADAATLEGWMKPAGRNCSQQWRHSPGWKQWPSWKRP